MARSPGLSKTKAIEHAIEQYVKSDAYERVRACAERSPGWSTTPPSWTVLTPSARSNSIAGGADAHDPTCSSPAQP